MICIPVANVIGNQPITAACRSTSYSCCTFGHHWECSELKGGNLKLDCYSRLGQYCFRRTCFHLVFHNICLYCWLFLIRNLLCIHCLPAFYGEKRPWCSQMHNARGWCGLQHAKLVRPHTSMLFWFAARKQFSDLRWYRKQVASKHKHKKIHNPGALRPGAFRLCVVIIQYKSRLWTVSWKGLRG